MAVKKKLSISSKKCRLTLFQAFSKLNERELQEIILHLNDDCIDQVCKVLFNIFHNTLPMSSKRRNKLLKMFERDHKNLRDVINKSHPTKKRRMKLMRQTKKGLKTLLTESALMLNEMIDSSSKKR